MDVVAIHNRLERLCNLLRVESRDSGGAAGLLPVQLEALHYLAQCNRYSDSVQAVADYLGQTKGTVSRTLAVLAQRGLIDKHVDPDDRRVVHLQINKAGRQVLRKAIPPAFLRKGATGLGDERAVQLQQALTDLLLAAQRARGGRSFGACYSCRFNELVEGRYRCGLTGEPLSLAETRLICREHDYPRAG